MAELDARNGTLFRDEIDYPLEAIALLVVPEAKAMLCDASRRLQMDSFGTNDAGPADCPRAKVNKVPLIGKSVFRRVLAHWREHNSITAFDPSQSYGAKEMRIRIPSEDSARRFATE